MTSSPSAPRHDSEDLEASPRPLLLTIIGGLIGAAAAAAIALVSLQAMDATATTGDPDPAQAVVGSAEYGARQ